MIDFMEMKGKARTARKAEQALNETFSRLFVCGFFMNSDLVLLSQQCRFGEKLSSRYLDLISCALGIDFSSSLCNIFQYQ